MCTITKANIEKKKEKRLEAYNDINILLFTKMYEVNIR